MSTNRNTINSSEEFQLITDKRLALESLIKIAAGVHNQQQALNELALAARPSQDIPKKIIRYFTNIQQKLADESVPEIIKKLDAIELITEKTLSHIFHLTSLDVHSLRAEQLNNISVESFSKAIDDFKKRTQSALAFRFVLQQRGVVVPPFKLPIPQESVYLQVEDLKQKEHDCVEQIKVEIHIIIKDTDIMLKQDSFSDEMKYDLKQINNAMLANLKHLDNGGLVTEIPHVFEIVTLETAEPFESKESEETNITEQKSNPEKKIKENKSFEAKQQKRSFWWLLKKWLSSPWSTSWSSIKQKYDNR